MERPESDARSAVMQMEANLRAWITPETYKKVINGDQLKHLVHIKGESYLHSTSSSLSDPEFRNRYAILCRRLDMQEIDETIFGKEDEKVELQPLPSYDQLLREQEENEARVAAFMKGKNVVFQDEISQKKTREVKEKEPDSEPTLPLVDRHNQMQLRREIVLQHLERVMSDVAQSLNIPTYKNVWENVKNLVSTFELLPSNIIYSPPIWTLIGLAMLQLLAIKESSVRQAIESENGKRWLTTVLQRYELDGGYLHRLAAWLTDLDYILSKCSAPTFGSQIQTEMASGVHP